MKYLEIKNKGLIEPEALTLLGGTTKANDDSKIGMFGSGNKYALAYFIRNGIGLNIFSGENEIKIETNKKVFRGEEMNVITVNGSETSITDKTGPKWSLWQCIREIYSNAVDEGLLSFRLVDEITKTNDSTSFYLEAKKEVIEFFQNRELYLYSDDRVLFECEYGRILKKHGEKANLYRRGIRCYDTETKSLYDYDIFDISINESRLIESDSMAKQAIWALISRCDNHEIVKYFLENHTTQSDRVLENNYYIDYWTSNYQLSFSSVWDKIFENHYVAPYKLGGYVQALWRDQTFFVQDALYKKLVKRYGSEVSALKGANGDNIKYIIKDPTPLEVATIKKAKEFFTDCNFIINYSVYVVDFLVEKESMLMGLAHNENILISSYCIEKGVQYVVDAIFEEYVHLKHNVSDETRNMQNALIGEMINYMKFKNCIVI